MTSGPGDQHPASGVSGDADHGGQGQGHVVGGQDGHDLANSHDVVNASVFKRSFVGTAFVRHPYLVLLLVWSVILFISAIVFGTGMWVQSESSDRDFSVKDHPISKRRWAVERAQEFVATGAGKGVAQTPQTIEVDAWRIIVMYKSRTGATVATKANFDQMLKVERRLMNERHYSKYCLIGQTGTCTSGPGNAHLSFLEHIGYDESWTQGMIDTQMASAAQQIATNTGNSTYLRSFFSWDFAPEKTSITWMRSIFRFGGPIAGYRNVRDREKDQNAKFDDLIRKWDDIIRVDSMDTKTLKVYYTGEAAWDVLLQIMVAKDLLWAIGAIVFVWCYMSFHLRSFFLSSWGMLQILSAFPLGFFVYRVVLGIEMFQSIHVIVIFLALGLGADNLFVMCDAFNQGLTYRQLARDPELHMAWTWRRAAGATLVTNGTTVAAFLATMTSKIIPIATFGAFSSCVLTCSYLISVTSFPCLIVIWDRYLRNCGMSCQCLRCGDSGGKVVDGHNSNQAEGDEESGNGRISKPRGVGAPVPVQMKRVGGSNKSLPEAGQEEVEMQEVSSPGTGAAGDSPPLPDRQESSQVLRHSETRDSARGPDYDSGDEDEDEEDRYSSRMADMPPTKEEVQEMSQSFSTVAMESGQLRRLELFFLLYWAPAIHRYRYVIVCVFVAYIIAACVIGSRLEPLSEPETFFPKGTFIRDSLDAARTRFFKTVYDNTLLVYVAWGVKGIDMSGVSRFDPDDIGKVVFDPTFDLSDPLAQQAVLRTCRDLEDSTLVFDRNVDCFMADYANWRVNVTGRDFPADYSGELDRRANFTSDLLRFVAEFRVSDRVDYVDKNHIGVDPDGNLRFVMIDAISPLKIFQPYSITYPVYSKWKKFVADQNDLPGRPETVNKAFQTALLYWGWMISERELASSSARGMMLAGGVAFFVLLVSTHNLWMSIYSIICIGSVVAGVAMVMVLQGWELGASESIALVIISGFSVDYLVHIAHSYLVSYRRMRSEKTEDALVTMGISIVSGGLTTMGSASMLFGATIIFFTKFATVFVSTISFALFASLVGLSSVLNIIGPEGDSGSLVYYYYVVKTKFLGSGQSGDVPGRGNTPSEQAAKHSAGDV